jgi:hypothetical protein
MNERASTMSTTEPPPGRRWGRTGLLAGVGLLFGMIAGLIAYWPTASTVLSRWKARQAGVAQQDAPGSPGKRGSPGARNLPAFVQVPGPKTVENDPASPSYDPTTLLVATRYVPKPIFDAEPRDEVWASAIEPRVKRRLEREIAHRAPGVSFKGLDCRTLSCRLTMSLDPTVPGDLRNKAMEVVQRPRITYLMTFPSEEQPPNEVTVYLWFKKEGRDPAAYDRFYFEDRKSLSGTSIAPQFAAQQD